MPEIETYPPGTFCWVELSTHDGKDAKRFYTALFGWTAQDSPVGPDQVYTMLRLNGKDTGALYEMASEPGVGRFAIVADAQGATFGIIKLSAPAR